MKTTVKVTTPKEVATHNNSYTLHLTTWENDGDNYKTETWQDMTEEQLANNVNLIEQFIKYGENWDLYKPTPEVLDVIDCEESDEYWTDYLTDWICASIGMWNDGQDYRSIDNYKAEYINEFGAVFNVELTTTEAEE